MKAVIYREYGQPFNVLNIAEVPIPEIGYNEALVKVKAVGLNPRDINIVAGKLKFVSGKRFPKGVGADFSGVIEKLDSNVKGLKIGDNILGYIDSLDAGALAEYVVVNADSLSIKPSNIEFNAAAAIPCNYLTAWMALVTKANVRKGQSVIIYGASGGVGSAAIQIAKYLGAYVTAISSLSSQGHCLSMGADVVISYESDQISQLKNKYDVFFQVYSESGLLYSKAKKILKQKGHFITLIPNPIYVFRKIVNKILGLPHFHYILVNSDQKALNNLLKLTSTGVMQPFIDKEFVFNDYLSAISMLETGHPKGKIIITL